MKLKDLYDGIDDAKYNVEQAKYVITNILKKINQDICTADGEVISELEYVQDLLLELV